MIYPAEYNLPPILKGVNYDFYMVYKVDGVPVDLTSYSAALQARTSIDDATPVIDITSENSIKLRNDGSILIEFTADETSSFTAGTLVYDLKLTHPDNTKSRTLSGIWSVIEGVTR